MRVKKKRLKKREKETQQNEKHQTTNKNDATTDHGKRRYDNQVCYGPMRPTYCIHRYTYVEEKTKYVVKEGVKGKTPHAKKNDELPRTSKGMPANTNHNHISPIFIPP